MLFVILLAIDVILLFVTVKSSLFKKARIVYSLAMCVWGIKRFFDYFRISIDRWKDYFDNFEMAIPFQSEIQYGGIEIIKNLYKMSWVIAISVMMAMLILTIVLKRFDGNVDKAVFWITVVTLVGLPLGMLLYGIFTIVKIPYFIYILFIYIGNMTAVVLPSIVCFNTVCRGKKEAEM